MTTVPYITISDSVGDLIKRFRAIKYEPTWEDTSSFEYTAGGGIDHSVGAIVRLFEYVLKVRESESDSSYGTYLDLITFFNLRNPTPAPGFPSNLLGLTDHYGEFCYVKFRMNLTPSPLTTQLEGPNAIFVVPVTFIRIPDVGGSGS